MAQYGPWPFMRLVSLMLSVGDIHEYGFGSITGSSLKNLCDAADLSARVSRSLTYTGIDGDKSTPPTTIAGVWKSVSTEEEDTISVDGVTTCLGNPFDPPLDAIYPDAEARQWGPLTDSNGTDHYFQLILDNGGSSVQEGNLTVMQITAMGTIDALGNGSTAAKFGITIGAVSVEVNEGLTLAATASSLASAANAETGGSFPDTEWFAITNAVIGRRITGTAPISATLYVTPGVGDTSSAVTDFDDSVRYSDFMIMDSGSGSSLEFTI